MNPDSEAGKWKCAQNGVDSDNLLIRLFRKSVVLHIQLENRRKNNGRQLNGKIFAPYQISPLLL